MRRNRDRVMSHFGTRSFHWRGRTATATRERRALLDECSDEDEERERGDVRRQLEMQRSFLAESDQNLDALDDGLKRLLKQSEAMDEEFDKHNKIVKGLGGEVDTSAALLNRTANRVRKLTEGYSIGNGPVCRAARCLCRRCRACCASF